MTPAQPELPAGERERDYKLLTLLYDSSSIGPLVRKARLKETQQRQEFGENYGKKQTQGVSGTGDM